MNGIGVDIGGTKIGGPSEKDVPAALCSTLLQLLAVYRH